MRRTAFALVLCASPVAAQTIATTGTPDPLAITTAGPGQAPNAAIGSGGTYSVVVTAANQKVTAQIDTPMPAGTTLRITLTAPSGAVSMGAVSLDTSPKDIVVGMQVGTFDHLAISYRLESTVNSGVVTPTSRSVTLKIVAGP